MTGREIWPVFLAFIITAVGTRYLAPWLRRKKIDQTERTEGVQSHLKKAGTPTMGGLAILAGILVATLCSMPGHPRQGAVLFLVLGFGVIGFLDDYLKVFLKLRCTVGHNCPDLQHFAPIIFPLLKKLYVQAP